MSLGTKMVLRAEQGELFVGFVAAPSSGTPPYSFSIASGALPAGIELDPNSGAVAGTPTSAGVAADIVVRVTDAAAATFDLDPFSIDVAPASATPTNLVAPKISGTLKTGDTLSATTGVWEGSDIFFAHQWKANGVAIPGATAATYVIEPAYQFQAISVAVTATNVAGSASADSPATGRVAIDFGVKTRSRSGGFPVGAASGAAISGAGAADWIIDECGHLTPSGTYAAYKSYAASSYSLTIAGVTGPVPVTMRSNTAHIREATSVARGGQATVRPDSSSFCQLRDIMGVANGASGALLLGDVVLARSGQYNEVAELCLVAQPTGGFAAGSGPKIILKSEVENSGLDAKGNPIRGGGFKAGRIYFGGTTDWPLVISHVSFYSNSTTYPANAKLLTYQTVGGVSTEYCDFRLGPDAPNANSVLCIDAGTGTAATHHNYNHFYNVGKGVFLRSDITCIGNVFEKMKDDPFQRTSFSISNVLIKGNHAFDYATPAGGHPDFVQISGSVSGGLGTADMDNIVIVENTVARGLGVVDEDDTVFALISNAAPKVITNLVIRNNICINSQSNNIRVGNAQNPDIRANTCVHDIHTTETPGQGGAAKVMRETNGTQIGTGGTVTHNVANVIDWSAQPSVTASPNAVLPLLTQAEYDTYFTAFPTAAGAYANTRQAVFGCVKGKSAVLNPDGTANGALFPDGSYNDLGTYVSGRLPPAV